MIHENAIKRYQNEVVHAKNSHQWELHAISCYRQYNLHLTITIAQYKDQSYGYANIHQSAKEYEQNISSEIVILSRKWSDEIDRETERERNREHKKSELLQQRQ